MAVLDGLKRELARYRQRPFLDALMAGCALVATADGTVSLSERSRVDRIFESLVELEIFDPHEAVNRFNEFADDIAADAARGRHAALDAIAEQAGDEARARLLLRACVAVSLADDDLRPEERARIADICDALDLPESSLDEALDTFVRPGKVTRREDRP
jgi:tellurite resistance protein